MVEHNLAKVGVAGSSPVSRSRTVERRERTVRTEKVGRQTDGIPLSIVYAEKLLLSKPYDH